MVHNQDARPESAAGQKRSALARVLIFLSIFAVLQFGYTAARGGPLERLVIDQTAVKVAAWIINLVDEGANVVAQGSRLRSPGGTINILAGCEGVDALLLLGAAMVIAPISGGRRIQGLLIGLPAVFALNQIRIISLFYAFRVDAEAFNLLHGTLLPMLIVAAIAAFFIYWCARAPDNQAAPA